MFRKTETVNFLNALCNMHASGQERAVLWRPTTHEKKFQFQQLTTLTMEFGALVTLVIGRIQQTTDATQVVWD